MSEVCCWVARYLVLASPQILPMRGAMPIACSTSALRRPASARLLRVPTCVPAMRAGPRVMNSDISVRLVRISAPIRAATPIQRMEQEADQQVERHPRQVEQRGRTGRDEERADLIEVAHRRETVALPPGLERQLHHDVVDARAQPLVERRRDAHHHARADHVEDALEGEQRQRQDRQGDQRRNAPARQHPVIHFQHVERAGEIEDVDQAADHRDRDEGVPAGRHRLAQFGRPRLTGRRTDNH